MVDTNSVHEPTAPSPTTIKRLFALSANRCAFAKCSVALVEGQILVGEVCHIRAAKPTGPRYDPNQTSAERHGFDNLILLCGTHHTVIDADEEAYTVERLLNMKRDHEQRGPSTSDTFASEATALWMTNLVASSNQSGGITAQSVTVHHHNYAAPMSVKDASANASPVVGAKDWKELSSEFRRLANDIRADWTRTTPSTGYSPGEEQWHIAGGHGRKECEALCKLAGAMLLRSPNTSRTLSDTVRLQNDLAWRWLVFLNESKGVEKHVLFGDGTDVDGTKYLTVMHSIEGLAAVSARVCTECAANEM